MYMDTKKYELLSENSIESPAAGISAGGDISGKARAGKNTLSVGKDGQLSVMEKLQILTDAAAWREREAGRGWEIRSLPVSATALRRMGGAFRC